MTTIEVKGLKELSIALRALPRELASKGGGPLRSAIFQAAKVIRDEAIRRAPERTGNLKRNIVAARMRKTKQGTQGYFVEVRRKKRKYAATKANVRTGKAGKSYDVREAYYGMMVELGTEKMPAQPFLRPAFESKKLEAVAKFREAFAAAIQRAAKKVAK